MREYIAKAPGLGFSRAHMQNNHKNARGDQNAESCQKGWGHPNEAIAHKYM